MAGLTAAGFEIRTQAELQALLEEHLEAAFPEANVRAGPFQQITAVLSEELAIAWEALQAVYAAMYPDGASGVALDQLAALTGTTRRAATRSNVIATVNLNAGVTLPAGSIAAVAGSPDSQFRSTEAVTNGGAVADDVEVIFESVATGPIAAPSGSLSVIVTPVTGWNSITNVDAAELGLEVATDAELREQRVIELAGAGQDSYAAIRAAVAKVAEVESVTVYGNETMSTDADGRPAKSFEAVIWDGSPAGAADDAIAQAIWDAKPAGISSHGVGSSGTAEDETGAARTVSFTRATKLRVYVAISAKKTADAGAGWADQVKAAIAARGDLYAVGEDAYASHLIAAAQALATVAAVTVLTLEADDPTPDLTLQTAAYDELIRIAAGDVTVTEV